MAAIEERISDRYLLKLLRAMLRAGVMEDGAVRRDQTGTPQGGVISPCLCNVYLDRLDRQWTERGTGVLVRFADDLLVLCHDRREAEAALGGVRSILAEMGLSLKQAKTRIVHLREGGEGLDFLGFHHRRVHGERGYEHLRFLARWPSREAMSRARNRIRELTGRKRALLPVEEVVREVNDYLRGWANYYRYGNSRLHFTKIRTYALKRLVLFAAKRAGIPTHLPFATSWTGRNRRGARPAPTDPASDGRRRHRADPWPRAGWRVRREATSERRLGRLSAGSRVGEPHRTVHAAARGHWAHRQACSAGASAGPQRERARQASRQDVCFPRMQERGGGRARPRTLGLVHLRSERNVCRNARFRRGSTTPGRRSCAPSHGVTRCVLRARRLLRLLEEQRGQPGRRSERPRDRHLARAPRAQVTPSCGGHPRR